MTNKHVTTFANLREEVFLGITNADQVELKNFFIFLLDLFRVNELILFLSPRELNGQDFLF